MLVLLENLYNMCQIIQVINDLRRISETERIRQFEELQYVRLKTQCRCGKDSLIITWVELTQIVFCILELLYSFLELMP